MPEYLAPGVFVEEVSFRAKSIEGVSTSTTAFAGPTRRGPLTGVPEVLTSFADFERLYGGMEGRHLDYELIPTVIFSHPPIGTVGISEAAARAEYGDAVTVYTSTFTPMYYALGTKSTDRS